MTSTCSTTTSGQEAAVYSSQKDPFGSPSQAIGTHRQCLGQDTSPTAPPTALSLMTCTKKRTCLSTECQSVSASHSPPATLPSGARHLLPIRIDHALLACRENLQPSVIGVSGNKGCMCQTLIVCCAGGRPVLLPPADSFFRNGIDLSIRPCGNQVQSDRQSSAYVRSWSVVKLRKQQVAATKRPTLLPAPPVRRSTDFQHGGDRSRPMRRPSG